MPYTELITPQELAEHLDDPHWLVADCRYLLNAPDEKEGEYRQEHIAGAIYVHLDRDLSAKVVPGRTGRHPLPSRKETARRLGQMGIGPRTQVVAYDDAGGTMAAVRLWWMLRWAGHSAAAILGGGWQAWRAAGLATRSGVETRPPAALALRPALEKTVDLAGVERVHLDPAYALVDARMGPRYRGEVEPIDRLPGHIPGAVSLPYTDLMSADLIYLAPEQLRAIFTQAIGDTPPERVIFYCGSGVTSVVNLLAYRLAGLGSPYLYPGSYSEWVADGARPVTQGPRR